MSNVEHEILLPYRGWVRHLAPVPVLYRMLDWADLADFNGKLADVARQVFTREILDVPDERHLEDLGSVPTFPGTAWREPQRPAVGVWHRVRTNDFLNVADPSVERFRDVVLDSHRHIVETVGEDEYYGSQLMENWIQFYQQGDYKVLHNHERYVAPFIQDMWVGVYYVSDGDPDLDKKYSGLLSFSIRGCNYLIRPKPGLLLMWPSDILHEVHPFYGKSERIVVNFHIRNGA
jgi:hypothetical protein